MMTGPGSDPTQARNLAVRARILSPLGDGSRLLLDDGVVEVARGVIAWVGPASDYRGTAPVEDLRPYVLIPGLVDLHAHLPQLPITADGGPDSLMSWLEESMAPVERDFTASVAASVASQYFRRFAQAGTTTAVLYGSADAGSTEESFQAAADHGLRLVFGQCLMDKQRYDDLPEEGITERRLAESTELCRRWNGYDEGRVRYAFTPRYPGATTLRMMSESARLAREMGAFWQTHLAEDLDDVALVAAEFPQARDYVDLYESVGALAPNAVLAHGVHISPDERRRLKESGSTVVHCPSNVFGVGSILDLGVYRAEGIQLGLGSDVGGATDISLFTVMQIGWLCQQVRLKLVGGPVVDDLWSWLELATIEGARALGDGDRIGSLEVGKEFDAIAVDGQLNMLVPGPPPALERFLYPAIFRVHPDMVRRAWVRGRELAGPAEAKPS